MRTTSECGPSDRISIPPQCVLGAFTTVLWAVHLCDRITQDRMDVNGRSEQGQSFPSDKIISKVQLLVSSPIRSISLCSPIVCTSSLCYHKKEKYISVKCCEYNVHYFWRLKSTDTSLTSNHMINIGCTSVYHCVWYNSTIHTPHSNPDVTQPTSSWVWSVFVYLILYRMFSSCYCCMQNRNLAYLGANIGQIKARELPRCNLASQT